jgi:hypothetical protein
VVHRMDSAAPCMDLWPVLPPPVVMRLIWNPPRRKQEVTAPTPSLTTWATVPTIIYSIPALSGGFYRLPFAY